MLALPRPYELGMHRRTLSTTSKSPSAKPKHSAPASIAANTPTSTTQQQSQSQSSSTSRTPDLRSINAFTVSQASAGGMRGRVPPRMKTDSLPPGYRAAARRVTLAMISAPIAIVTSYYLAMRIWGGAEQKTFEVKGKQENT